MLTCSGVRKHYKLKCWGEATWAVRALNGDTWHGACHQHIHQVLKAYGATGEELVVRTAASAMEENDKIRQQNRALMNEGGWADRCLDVLRPLVLDSDDVWTGERVAAILGEHRFSATSVQGHELLELLCEEHVVEHQGHGKYVCIAHLPEYAQYEPGT